MSQAITINTKRSFYEKVILNLLSKMNLGTLNVTMPNGELVRLGEGQEVIANIEVRNNDFFRRCVLYGDIGFGEAYVDGDWDTDNIFNVIKWFIINIENAPTVSGSNTKNLALNILKIFNKIYHFKRANSVNGSRKNISEHYDLHNDFFALFLDPSMTYSSAYFKEEEMDLQQAQFEKYDRLCKQLRLKPTDHVLEIGSG
ncbi:MAG: class I SAM-dependent methyltransferase, partial [Bacteroidia bacterium]